MKHSFITLVCVTLMAASAGAGQVPPQPAPAAGRDAVAETPSDYVIGAEDVLGIVFWREAEISGDVTVRPDGRITVPVIGEMVATGLRPAELQARIVTAATKYLTDPNVAVVVRTINSRRVFVTGRVTTPGGHLRVIK